MKVFKENTKGVAFEALESQSRYPSIVPRYKEKVESNVLDEIDHEITFMVCYESGTQPHNTLAISHLRDLFMYSVKACPV
jgi:hypothetical protein